MKKVILALVISSLAFCGLAQNIKDETVEYTYIKLPSQPIEKSIKNFQSTIIATYEEENARKRKEYELEKQKAEDEFRKEEAEHPKKVKEAEDKYAKELEEWNKKSTGNKIIEKQILNENNKPVKNIPSMPYKRYVSEPQLRTSYDYPVLASSYLNLDGFNNNPANAVKIQVTLYGYDYTQPQQKTLQKDITSYANGQTSTRPVTYYYLEFSYRHPMAIKVTSPDGKEILNVTPQAMNNYKIYKSGESDKPLNMDSQQLIKTYEERILQENLKMMNDMVNDLIAYQRTKRKAELSYVKAKDDTYRDLQTAYQDASDGLKLLMDDEKSAQHKISGAIQTWETALKESDLTNKKARIDKGVTTAICFNLLESHFALRKTESVENIFALLNTLDPGTSDRKKKEEYQSLFNDLKKRIQINK